MIAADAKVSCKHGLRLVAHVNQNWFTGPIIDMHGKKRNGSAYFYTRPFPGIFSYSFIICETALLLPSYL